MQHMRLGPPTWAPPSPPGPRPSPLPAASAGAASCAAATAVARSGTARGASSSELDMAADRHDRWECSVLLQAGPTLGTGILRWRQLGRGISSQGQFLLCRGQSQAVVQSPAHAWRHSLPRSARVCALGTLEGPQAAAHPPDRCPPTCPLGPRPPSHPPCHMCRPEMTRTLRCT